MEKIELLWGNATSRTITITASGSPVDLTGKTVIFTVKKQADINDANDDNAIIRKTITTHSNPSVGETLLELSAADTTIPEGTYYADFRIPELQKNSQIFQFIISKIITRTDV